MLSNMPYKFQFHKGTIKTFVKSCCILLQLLHFNSIKVRLKLSENYLPNVGNVFQFHKGTIKTSGRAGALSILSLFQFHKGTIKTVEALVREATSIVFQFHKGTIKTIFTLNAISEITKISIP